MQAENETRRPRYRASVRTREIRVLNLGAGVQSTALYLMSMDPEEAEVPAFDFAIFGDTQDEPEAVYRHLEWLESLGGPPILKGTVGRLGDDLTHGLNSTGQRFASIPAFTTKVEGTPGGKTRRQCTKEYKIDVVDGIVRREILGVAPRKHFPRDVLVHQYFGLSHDEPRRIVKVQDRFRSLPHARCHFPLWDMEMTRGDCVAWLKDRVPHEVPRSACVFCPFKANAEWRRLRDEDPQGWARAVQVDNALRTTGAVANRTMDQKMYVHRSCLPLAQAPIDAAESKLDQHLFGFAQECEGMCGN